MNYINRKERQETMINRKGVALWIEMVRLGVGMVVLLALGLAALKWEALVRVPVPLDVRSATYKYGKYDVSFGKTKALALCKCKRHAIAEDPEFEDSEEFTMGVYISGCDWEADPHRVDVRGMKCRWAPDDHEFLGWGCKEMGEVARFILEEEAKEKGEEVEK